MLAAVIYRSSLAISVIAYCVLSRIPKSTARLITEAQNIVPSYIPIHRRIDSQSFPPLCRYEKKGAQCSEGEDQDVFERVSPNGAEHRLVCWSVSLVGRKIPAHGAKGARLGKQKSRESAVASWGSSTANPISHLHPGPVLRRCSRHSAKKVRNKASPGRGGFYYPGQLYDT